MWKAIVQVSKGDKKSCCHVARTGNNGRELHRSVVRDAKSWGKPGVVVEVYTYRVGRLLDGKSYTATIENGNVAHKGA